MKEISVFIGMQYSLEDNLKYISIAHENGFDGIFTSLHIPEANHLAIVSEFNAIIDLAIKLNMKITADISPRAFDYLNIKPDDIKSLHDMGIYCIRLDFGFGAEQIAQFSQNPYGLKIEINASTVTPEFLIELDEFEPNYSNMRGCHNYYPRRDTGISEESLLNKNKMLKKKGFEITAFIPSQSSKRGPIFEGLPTLEMHRYMKPVIAADHLFALGCDNVCFGDSIPDILEIKEVGALKEKSIMFKVKIDDASDVERTIIFSPHKNRPDCPENIIRCEWSRLNLQKDIIILPRNNIIRTKGSITIDNNKYLRYMGELQICKINLSKDLRVNVLGKIEDDYMFLLKYIDDNKEYYFIEE